MSSRHRNTPIAPRGTVFSIANNPQLDTTHFTLGVPTPNLFTLNLVDTLGNTHFYSYQKQVGFDWNKEADIKHADLWKFQILKRKKLVLPPTRQRLAALPGAVTGAYGNGNASGGNMNAGHALQNPPQHFTQSGAPIYARAKQSKRGGESETELNLGSESEDMEEEDSLAALASGAVSPILGMMMDKGPNGAKPHSPSHVSTTNSRKRRDSSSISNMHPDTESQPSSESSSGPASASALDLVLDPALFDQPLPEHEAKRGHTEQTNSMFSSTNMLENSSAQHLAKQTRVEHGFDQWTDGNSHTLAQNVPNLPEISDHDYWNQWAIIGDNWARLNHERGASGN